MHKESADTMPTPDEVRDVMNEMRKRKNLSGTRPKQDPPPPADEGGDEFSLFHVQCSLLVLALMIGVGFACAYNAHDRAYEDRARIRAWAEERLDTMQYRMNRLSQDFQEHKEILWEQQKEAVRKEGLPGRTAPSPEEHIRGSTNPPKAADRELGSDKIFDKIFGDLIAHYAARDEETAVVNAVLVEMLNDAQRAVSRSQGGSPGRRE